MFYCEDCRRPRRWPDSTLYSWGPCEICGRSKFCYEVPSKLIPPESEDPIGSNSKGCDSPGGEA